MSNLKFIQVGDSFNAIGLNVVWVIIGLITIYAGIKNLLDKENPSRVGTAVFWCPCSDHVPAADLQESKNRKNR
jgi:uncharacterized membrane protein